MAVAGFHTKLKITDKTWLPFLVFILKIRTLFTQGLCSQIRKVIMFNVMNRVSS